MWIKILIYKAHVHLLCFRCGCLSSIGDVCLIPNKSPWQARTVQMKWRWINVDEPHSRMSTFIRLPKG